MFYGVQEWSYIDCDAFKCIYAVLSVVIGLGTIMAKIGGGTSSYIDSWPCMYTLLIDTSQFFYTQLIDT
jgi:hypothetical protein